MELFAVDILKNPTGVEFYYSNHSSDFINRIIGIFEEGIKKL